MSSYYGKVIYRYSVYAYANRSPMTNCWQIKLLWQGADSKKGFNYSIKVLNVILNVLNTMFFVIYVYIERI